MESVLTPVAGKPSMPMRVLDRLLTPLCLLGSLLVTVAHGKLALGMVSFYLGLQCGALHLVRLFGYELPASARYATAGVALGVAFSLHAVLRAAKGGGVYLEYVGGPPVGAPIEAMVVALQHVVVPLASLTHLRGAPVVPPWPAMMGAAAEVAVVALAHEAVVDGSVRTLSDGASRATLGVSSVASAAAWALLLETANRVLSQSRAKQQQTGRA